MDSFVSTSPEHGHCAKGAERLLSLQEPNRPRSISTLEIFLKRRGCCSYRAAVPVPAVAAWLRTLADETDVELREALQHFDVPTDGANSAAAKAVAVRLLSRFKQLKQTQHGFDMHQFSEYIWSNSSVERRTGPNPLVMMLIQRGALSQSGDGKLSYIEPQLYQLKDSYLQQTPSEPQPERVNVNFEPPMGRLAKFVATDIAKRMRQYGLEVLTNGWIKQVCGASFLKDRPETNFTDEGCFLSFDIALSSPQLASNVRDVAKSDIESRFSSEWFEIAVPVPVSCVRFRGSRIGALEGILRCRISEDLRGYMTVVRLPETEASKEQICEIVVELFGNASVFRCGSFLREDLDFISRDLLNHVEQTHGVHLQVEDNDIDEAWVSVFGCLHPDPQGMGIPMMGGPSSYLDMYRARREGLTDHISLDLRHMVDEAKIQRLARDSGVHPEIAFRALQARHGDAKQAMDFIFAEKRVDTLVEMGFARDRAVAALFECSDDLEAAASLLLLGLNYDLPTDTQGFARFGMCSDRRMEEEEEEEEEKNEEEEDEEDEEEEDEEESPVSLVVHTEDHTIPDPTPKHQASIEKSFDAYNLAETSETHGRLEQNMPNVMLTVRMLNVDAAVDAGKCPDWVRKLPDRYAYMYDDALLKEPLPAETSVKDIIQRIYADSGVFVNIIWQGEKLDQRMTLGQKVVNRLWKGLTWTGAVELGAVFSGAINDFEEGNETYKTFCSIKLVGSKWEVLVQRLLAACCDRNSLCRQPGYRPSIQNPQMKTMSGGSLVKRLERFFKEYQRQEPAHSEIMEHLLAEIPEVLWVEEKRYPKTYTYWESETTFLAYAAGYVVVFKERLGNAQWWTESLEWM